MYGFFCGIDSGVRFSLVARLCEEWLSMGGPVDWGVVVVEVVAGGASVVVGVVTVVGGEIGVCVSECGERSGVRLWVSVVG